MTNPYEIAYQQSIEDPDTFWAKAAEDCHWYKNGTRCSMTATNLFIAGLAAGRSTPVTNALDYHIENGRGEQNAIIYDSSGYRYHKKIHL